VLVRLTGNSNSGTAWNYNITYQGGVQQLGSIANGTIRNDDIANSSIWIEATDSYKYEGDSGTTIYTFTATRDGDTNGTASVDWVVAGHGANPADGLDFIGGVLPSGTISFAAGETTKTISVEVSGDVDYESDEGFSVTLENPVGASLGSSTVSTSINDRASGGSEIKETYYTIDAPGTGDFELSYEMYSIPDQADIYVNGSLAATTGGLVSGTGVLSIDGTTLDAGDQVLVRLTGNSNSGTAWNYNITYQGGVQQLGSIANGTIRNDDSQAVQDDYTQDIYTTGVVNVGGSVTGNIEESYDQDWFAINLTAGNTYEINLEGDDTYMGTLGDTYLRGIYDSAGNSISGTTNDDGGVGVNSLVTFTPQSSGTYFISAGGYGSNTGTYTLSVADITPQSQGFEGIYTAIYTGAETGMLEFAIYSDNSVYGLWVSETYLEAGIMDGYITPATTGASFYADTDTGAAAQGAFIDSDSIYAQWIDYGTGSFQADLVSTDVTTLGLNGITQYAQNLGLVI
jgi:hypothetical protein